MSDTLPRITHINVGEGAKAEVIVQPEAEEFQYMKTKGSGDSAYPLTVFCPKCSTTHEFNEKTGSWRQKWLVEPTDLFFTIRYEWEGGEAYAVCERCGLDLREEFVHGSEREQKEKVEEIHSISVQGVVYRDGGFLIPLEAYKKSIRAGMKWKCDILASVSGQNYRIRWPDYSNVENIESKDGFIHINRKWWKNRHH